MEKVLQHKEDFFFVHIVISRHFSNDGFVDSKTIISTINNCFDGYSKNKQILTIDLQFSYSQIYTNHIKYLNSIIVNS